MAAIWSSVALGVVVRVRESGVVWKSLKGGGGVVGRGGYWMVWVVAVGGVVAVVAVVTVGGGVEWQPDRERMIVNTVSANGATLYQHGAKAHERGRFVLVEG
jgi:hypothetical protein